jgi:hypothetical protein
MISENELNPAQKYKMEQVLFGMKKNKRNFVKKYGVKAEALMRKRALKIAKQYTPESTPDEMKDNRLKQLVQDVLSKPLDEKSSFTSKYDDKFNDKRKDLPDGLQKAILKKQGSLNEDEDETAEEGIINEPISEDIDLGHQDDEPHMLKADLYRIGKYAMELYKMIDQFEGEQEVDFPHWWQAKIINAKSCLVAAKHYLDFELKEPQIDSMVSVATQEDSIDEGKLTKPEERIVKALKKSGNFKKDDPQMYTIAKKLAEGILQRIKDKK